MNSDSDDEVLEIALLTVLFSRRQKRVDRKERCGCAVFSPSVDREANTTIDIIPPFRMYNVYDTTRCYRKCD